MCVVNLKSVNKLDLTWKQSFLIQTKFAPTTFFLYHFSTKYYCLSPSC